MKNIRFCLMYIAITVALNLAANAATLDPGETYEVKFTTVPTLCPGGVGSGCDTLEFALFTSVIGSPSLTADLFDGATLLGVNQSSSCCIPVFKSNTSIFTVLTPTVVDFTSIQSGAIQGRVDISVTGGSLVSFDPSNTGFFFLGKATSSNGTTGNALNVTSTAIMTPEVSTFGMLGGGLLWIAAARRRVKR
jgi:hypothetical protein